MRRLVVLAGMAACAPGAPPAPLPAPVSIEVVNSPATAALQLVAPDRRPVAEAAWRAGWMPLQPTRVPAFAARYPEHDGRGVLIAILDSGVDPAVGGLQQLPSGRPKVLDLRDFSAEGRIALTPVTRRGDTFVVHGRVLGGASRVAALAAGPVWGGVIAEVDLGEAPAADLNHDGVVGDTLPVLVARGTNGWLVFVDRHGDGSVADDPPVHDYAVAREWFGWSPRGVAPRLGVAVNLADVDGRPVLDLYFDTSGHGTHVAGIAAGHDIHGVQGFDGVAPGAMLLGLKIANNADGGVTVPGSIRAALAHAIMVAQARKMPLVVNLSFGVGNEEEGAAEIDALVDSVLAAHPSVVMTVAASNDGPGLSTLGFPGSATQILSIGATQPLVFTGLDPGDPTPDPIAYFSSRGAEFAGPDIVAPGTAWSTTPAFKIGDEQSSGTSMAAPHAAGLAARLVGMLHADGRVVRRSTVLQALRVSARPIAGATVLDQGVGVPDLDAAAQWLKAHETVPVLQASHASRTGRAAILVDANDGRGRGEVTIRRVDAAEPMPVRFRVDVPWATIEGPMTRVVDAVGFALQVRVRPDSVATAGVRIGTIVVEHAEDEGLGPLLVIPVAVRQALPASGGGSAVVSTTAGSAGRVPFLADTGLGLRIEVATMAPDQLAIAALHEPGGQPFRDGSVTAAGFRDGAALFEVDAGDVISGMYEVIVVAPPTGSATARVGVTRSPVRLGAAVIADSLEIHATSVESGTLEVRLRTALTGAALRTSAESDGLAVVRVAVPVPTWASRVAVDATMPREAWPTFTDFAVSVREPNGRLLEAAPLNYAFGRLTTAVPEQLRGDSMIIHLRPAPARTDKVDPWRLDLLVRFSADRPWALDDGGTSRASLAPAATRRVRFPLASWPLAIPQGFSPLVTVVALEGDDAVWTRELLLWGAGGPTR